MGKAIFSPQSPELEAQGALLAIKFFSGRSTFSYKMVMMFADRFYTEYSYIYKRDELASGFRDMAIIIAKQRLSNQ